MYLCIHIRQFLFMSLWRSNSLSPNSCTKKCHIFEKLILLRLGASFAWQDLTRKCNTHSVVILWKYFYALHNDRCVSIVHDSFSAVIFNAWAHRPWTRCSYNWCRINCTFALCASQMIKHAIQMYYCCDYKHRVRMMLHKDELNNSRSDAE